MKKYLIPLSVTGAIVLLLLVYFAVFNNINVYDAIPDSAVAVIEINDWSKFSSELNTKGSAIELKKTPAVQKLSDEVAFIGQFFLNEPELKIPIFDGKLTISAHLVSATDFDYLFTLPAKGLGAFHPHPGGNIAETNSRMFNNYQVQDVVMKDGTKFCFTYIKGILVCSFTSFLTESSVTAVTGGNNLNHDKEFRRLAHQFNSNQWQTETGVTGFAQLSKLFINFKKAGVFFPVAFRQQKLALLSDISANQSWGGYGILFSDDRVNFIGLSLLPASGKTAADKNVLANTIWNSVPDNAAYVNVGFNKLDTEEKGKPGDDNMAEAAFKDWVGESHAFVTLEPLKEDFNGQNVFIVQVTDEHKAIVDLQHLISMDGSKTTAIDTFVNLPIFSLKGGAAINQVFGSSFTAFGNTFFCISNHVAVFCNSADILKFTLEKISKGETLNKDATLRNTLADSKKASSILYINPAKAQQIFTGLLKEGSALQSYLSKLSGIAIVSGVSGEWNTTIASFVTGSGNKTGGGLLWKTRLKAMSGFIPQIVLNSSTGDKEIFTQDTADNVYLISKSGEVIFTKNIGEKIIGGVYQLDYYNNGQLQYIFNTPYHVFMLDRFGDDVASYPLRISSTALQGLTLVSGSGGHYRYYVPCSNGAVYGYEKNGRPLSGWSPRPGLGLIVQPMQEIKSKGSEYIAVFNNAGKLMLLGGKGEIKWSVDNLPHYNQAFSIVQTAGDFLVMNASGNQLIQVSSDGNENMRPLVDSAVSFVATAVSDTNYLYFFSSLHDVRSYNDKGEFKSALSLKASVTGGIKILNINNINYLLVKDETMKNAMLYNLSLQPVAGYEVADNNAFTITGLFNTDDLIGIQPDAAGNITCYRIK